MSKTLILLFHPDLSRSRANVALAAAAARLPYVEVADLQALYPDGVIDADREVARLLSADRIVLQFPVQWYSTPPLLKAWQDAVLTRMYYLAYETEGRLLEGKPLLVAATAGNVPEAYGRDGANKFTMAELLRPLEATAHRCGLPWQPPFLVYRADRLDDLALHGAARDYAAILDAWRRAGEPAEDPRRFLVEAWG
ncbi:NAD(P)H-dependent oxidoreductase [Shinella zoogloeoides]|uniref:NAD(P)H-dependent oxidoreductase n=1 Tax=Shinella zoogloeoides TaxID=352475 RepID=UPI00273D7771|nr:NAD(P)H-dependent oxidoreductase [Shinella zoogloeoides]WLR94560.1 NAD(P)H-dependent oxidoreductase [Shinella zoogloeoides]